MKSRPALNSLLFLNLILATQLFFSCNRNVENKDSYIKEDEKPPNFIFILADDQGWNGTSVQMMQNEPLSKSDYHETPNLEVLAENGIKFSNAYSAAPVCAPSRYGIQFAKSPARLSLIRVGMNTDHIEHSSTVSIPRALKAIDKNYSAAHFGKWGMGSNPEEFGYDVSDGATKNKDGGFVNDRTQWENSIQKDPKKIFDLTKKGIDFMEESVVNKKPFFLQISHYAVHANLEMKEKSLLKFENKKKGEQHINAGFAAMTQDLDEGLGLILSKVEALGIAQNTYVIYMSDNGSVPNIPGAKKYTKSYNYPLSRGKWDAMEGGVRVPLIISGPSIKSGRESSVPVSGCDILPTIIELAGGVANQLEQIDGGSFKTILFNETARTISRQVEGIFFHVPYKNGIAFKRPHSAVRVGNYKLVKFNDNDEVMLFDLESDYHELSDLSLEQPEKTRVLEQILNEYLTMVHAPKWKEGITWKKTPVKEINSTY